MEAGLNYSAKPADGTRHAVLAVALARGLAFPHKTTPVDEANVFGVILYGWPTAGSG